jgi:hypothetical protein
MRERKEQLAISVRFADGRNARLMDSAGLKSGLGPMITTEGGTWRGRGPERDEDFDFSVRVWPLPPAGPVVLTFSWPDLGIIESEVIIDGERAETLGRSLWGAFDANGTIASDSPGPISPSPLMEVPLLVGMEVHVARALAGRSDLYLEHSDPDGRPLASGVIVHQDPPAGTMVERFTAIEARVRDEADPPPFAAPDDPGGGGQPPGGVREPRRPLPGSDEGLAEATP